jgi:tight adherence protein B
MSRRRWRILTAGTITAMAMSLPLTPAYAAEGRIVQVESKAGRVDVVFEGRDLPDGQRVDPSSVTVTADGTQLRGSAKPLAEGGLGVTRSTILTLDVSGSMRGTKLDNAKRAALSFLDSAPPDVLIGLVAFGTDARLVVAPTSDRGRLRTSVQGLQLAGGTSLYDAINLSVQSVGRTGVRNVVLLSDGVDSDSNSNLATTVRTVRRSGVSLDVVAIEADNAILTLNQLTSAGQGRVYEATQAQQLGDLFKQSAEQLSGQMLFSAALPAGWPGGSASVTVTAKAGELTLQDTAVALLTDARDRDAELKAAGPQAVPVDVGLLSSERALYGAIAAVFLGAAVVLAFALNAVAGVRSGGGVRRRLAIYTLSGQRVRQEVEHTALGGSTVARSAVDLAGRVVAKRGLEERLGHKLEAASVGLKPAEWIILHGGVAILFPLFVFLLTGGSVMRALIGLLLGVAAPYLFLMLRESRRKKKFEADLPSTLQLMAGSLEAGYSLPQAADTVARESEDPIASEFNRAIIEARLGIPVEDALEAVAERMGSRDFSWVVMAIRIQREVGGNLAEILKTVAATLRERERLRRQILVLSAEGRLSAVILAGLPIVFAAYLILVRPEYIGILMTDILGMIMAGAGVLLMIVGILWMKKIVNVEV